MRKRSEKENMKVLVSDKLAPEGVKLLQDAPGIEVTVQTDWEPGELKEKIRSMYWWIAVNNAVAKEGKHKFTGWLRISVKVLLWRISYYMFLIYPAAEKRVFGLIEPVLKRVN